MADFVRRMFVAAGSIVVALFAIMMALTFLQVLNRYALGFQLFWTEEVVRLLLVWVVLLATPIGLYRRDEIAVDLIDFKRPAVQRAKVMLAKSASLVFCAILAWWSYSFTMRGVPAESPTLGISRAWFYAPMPIGAVMSIVALLFRGPRTEPGRELA